MSKRINWLKQSRQLNVYAKIQEDLKWFLGVTTILHIPLKYPSQPSIQGQFFLWNTGYTISVQLHEIVKKQKQNSAYSWLHKWIVERVRSSIFKKPLSLVLAKRTQIILNKKESWKIIKILNRNWKCFLQENLWSYLLLPTYHKIVNVSQSCEDHQPPAHTSSRSHYCLIKRPLWQRKIHIWSTTSTFSPLKRILEEKKIVQFMSKRICNAEVELA